MANAPPQTIDPKTLNAHIENVRCQLGIADFPSGILRDLLNLSNNGTDQPHIQATKRLENIIMHKPIVNIKRRPR
jgi:hypothetical protein